MAIKTSASATSEIDTRLEQISENPTAPLPRTPGERRRDKTRNAILQTARQIIHDEGPKSLSIRKIAERADYSPSAMYEFFDSKDSIIEALALEGFKQLTMMLIQVSPQLLPDERLVETGVTYVKFAIANPDVYALMFEHHPQVDDPEKNIQGSSPFSILAQLIADGVTKGIFTCSAEFDERMMAYAAWSVVHGVASLQLSFFSHIQSTQSEHMIRQVIEVAVKRMFCAGVSPQGES